MPDSQFGEASAELAKGLLTVKPFKISLSKFGFFKQSAYSTMWLGPDVEVCFLRKPAKRDNDPAAK